MKLDLAIPLLFLLSVFNMHAMETDPWLPFTISAQRPSDDQALRALIYAHWECRWWRKFTIFLKDSEAFNFLKQNLSESEKEQAAKATYLVLVSWHNDALGEQFEPEEVALASRLENSLLARLNKYAIKNGIFVRPLREWNGEKVPPSMTTDHGYQPLYILALGSLVEQETGTFNEEYDQNFL